LLRRKDGLDTYCKECKKNYQGQWLANPANLERYRSSVRKSVRGYYRKNTAKVLANTRAWQRRSINWRIRTGIATTISHTIKRGLRRGRCFGLVGYTVQELKTHLESRFLPGMTWDNYGEWHIDHVIPQAKFKYRTVDDPDFVACWALTNLQPLWRDDNLRKGSKVN
jgi:hypothetical protein